MTRMCQLQTVIRVDYRRMVVGEAGGGLGAGALQKTFVSVTASQYMHAAEPRFPTTQLDNWTGGCKACIPGHQPLKRCC